jgi:hypothetical protein
MTDRSLSSHDGLEDFDFSSSNIQEDSTSRSLAVAESVEPAMTPVFAFDYFGVSDAVAEEAEATAERIRNRHRASIIDTGNDLRSIKDKLAHGKFGNWLDYHFGMSERTAQNYMNAATAFRSAPKVVDVLPPSTVYKLAAKGAPEEVRQSVIDEIVGGVTPDHRQIESRIAAAKSDVRRKREEERAAQKEELDWQKHEQAMRKADKSDDEINGERKRWDTKKAQKERRQARTLSEAKKREEEALRAREERERQGEKMRQIAARAAEILKSRLGTDFENLRDAILKIDYYDFQEALKCA